MTEKSEQAEKLKPLASGEVWQLVVSELESWIE